MWDCILNLLWPAPSMMLPPPAPMRLSGQRLAHRGIRSLDVIIGAHPYHDPAVRAVIRAFKYHRRSELAAILADHMAASIPGLIGRPYDDAILCPVPLHWTRATLRGFNQSELLAQELSTRLSLPARTLLSRTRYTGAQARRPRHERQDGVADAFRFVGRVPAPGTVILVDDLCTSGATLSACAQELRKAGSKAVFAIVAALG